MNLKEQLAEMRDQARNVGYAEQSVIIHNAIIEIERLESELEKAKQPVKKVTKKKVS